MATKKDKAREKYKKRYGHEPRSDADLTVFETNFMSTSDYAGASDYSSGASSSTSDYSSSGGGSDYSSSGGGDSSGGGSFSDSGGGSSF